MYKPYLPIRFEDQARVLLDAKVPAFSFIYGIPPKEILEECRTKSIVTIGAATTPDEAAALQEAGVDAIAASGFEAGGHRGSFLRAAEDSLTGTMSLVPKWAFDDATFDRSAGSFDNPDHVSIVIHNYRWRLGLADGEPKYGDLEKRLAEGPVITVPAITLKVTPMAHHTRMPVRMPKNFRANMHTGSSRAESGTICLRKPRRPLPRLSSMSTVIDRR